MIGGFSEPAMNAERPCARPLLPALQALFCAGVLALCGACSIQRYAIDSLSDALAHSGGTFASDDDPELIRQAVPFSLKLIESVLTASPQNEGLLLASARGFSQYSYAFVQQDSDQIADQDLARAEALRTQARKLYMRAQRYALRGLAVRHPGIETALRTDPRAALKDMTRADVPFLYWSAVSIGAAIAISKDHPEIIADQPIVEALIDRALELEEDYEFGAIHDFLIVYEKSRVGARVGWEVRSRAHFERAVAESDHLRAGPYVALAETVAVQNQDRSEFVALLGQALAIDVDERPEWRLQNLVLQNRARWLISREDELFVE
jgi:predicted anti-sigma-YlaC factor YlaD